MNQTLLNFVLALATNEFLHNIIESKAARNKVSRLESYINKRPYKEMRHNIDTRAKSYAIAAVAFIVMVGILFGLYTLLDISGDRALRLIAAMMILSYAALGGLMDKFHVEIEKVTKKFKK